MVKLDFSTGNGTNYTLNCVNNSSNNWYFYVFQKMPNQPKDVFSLAWFVSPYKVASGDFVEFTWTIDYTFVWGKSGLLKPGIIYTIGGKKDCSPDDNNQTTFDLVDDTPTLSPAIPGGQPGSLTIHGGSNIPNNSFSTGIGMSGQGTFAMQTLQNVDQVYTPDPEYYVAAANQIQMGCVLAQQVTMVEPFKFDPNVYHVTATLGDDNKWTISQS